MLLPFIEVYELFLLRPLGIATIYYTEFGRWIFYNLCSTFYCEAEWRFQKKIMKKKLM